MKLKCNYVIFSYFKKMITDTLINKFWEITVKKHLEYTAADKAKLVFLLASSHRDEANLLLSHTDIRTSQN